MSRGQGWSRYLQVLVLLVIIIPVLAFGQDGQQFTLGGQRGRPRRGESTIQGLRFPWKILTIIGMFVGLHLNSNYIAWSSTILWIYWLMISLKPQGKCGQCRQLGWSPPWSYQGNFRLICLTANLLRNNELREQYDQCWQ